LAALMDGKSPDGLFDAGAALRPLLDACPGSSFVSSCGLCGQRIDGPAELFNGGSIRHPGECPPPKPPAGMLL